MPAHSTYTVLFPVSFQWLLYYNLLLHLRDASCVTIVGHVDISGDSLF